LKTRKKINEIITIEIPNPDLNKIYIYIRDWKKLNPVPYVFNLEIKKIKEVLNKANDAIKN
jgi:hypothetical protein